MPRRLADFMKDFNEKNIYHLFTLLMEDQIRMTSEQIFGCCCWFMFIEDPAITGLII